MDIFFPNVHNIKVNRQSRLKSQSKQQYQTPLNQIKQVEKQNNPIGRKKSISSSVKTRISTFNFPNIQFNLTKIPNNLNKKQLKIQKKQKISKQKNKYLEVIKLKLQKLSLGNDKVFKSFLNQQYQNQYIQNFPQNYSKVFSNEKQALPSLYFSRTSSQQASNLYNQQTCSNNRLIVEQKDNKFSDISQNLLKLAENIQRQKQNNQFGQAVMNLMLFTPKKEQSHQPDQQIQEQKHVRQLKQINIQNSQKLAEAARIQSNIIESHDKIKKLKAHFLQVNPQFSINFNLKKKQIQKINNQCQTQNNDQKIIIDFIKSNQNKILSLKEIDSKYAFLKKKIAQTQNFEQKYNSLITYIQNLPNNKTGQRVFALSTNLQNKQKIYQNKLIQFIDKSKGFQKEYVQMQQKYKEKQNSLFSSILRFLTLVSNQFQRNAKFINSKFSRILNRTINLLIKYQSYKIQQSISSAQFVRSFVPAAQNLMESHNQWTQVLVQNRILIYNFIKQIQQLSAISITLFGSLQAQTLTRYQNGIEVQKGSNYLLTKCQDCYDFQQKIKYIQLKNFQLKPIMSSLQHLIRDGSKKKNLFSIL